MGLDARLKALEQERTAADGGGILVTWQNPIGTFWKWDPELKADRKLTPAEVATMGAPGTVVKTYGVDLSLL